MVESRKNQDKLNRNYIANIIQNFTAPRHALLWNNFVRKVGRVEPAHYKIDRKTFGNILPVRITSQEFGA